MALITLKIFKQKTVFCLRACMDIRIGNFLQPEEVNEMHGIIRKIILEKTLPMQNTLKLFTREV